MQIKKNSFRKLGDPPEECEKIINYNTIVWNNLTKGVGEKHADPATMEVSGLED